MVGSRVIRAIFYTQHVSVYYTTFQDKHIYPRDKTTPPNNKIFNTISNPKLLILATD